MSKDHWLASTQIIPGPDGWMRIELVAISRDRGHAIAGCKKAMETLTFGCRHYVGRQPSIIRFNQKVGEYVARARFTMRAEAGDRLTMDEAIALVQQQQKEASSPALREQGAVAEPVK